MKDERTWKMLELYPEFSNEDIIFYLRKINAPFHIEMKGFIKAKLTKTESNFIENMVFVHNHYYEQKNL